MPSLPTKRSSKAILIAIVALATLLPVAANAAAGFDDVADSSPFVADIQWLADAGVTKGCNPPANDMFCPGNNVTREQMAAFMHRLALSREVDAGTLNGMADTDFVAHGTIVTTTAGTGWLEHSLEPSTVGRNVTSTTVSGDGMMVLPLTAPTTIGGVAYNLESIEFCVTRYSGSAYVTHVTASRMNDDGTSTTVLTETDDFSSGCHTFDVGGASAGMGIGFLAETDGSAVNTIRLGSVRATWTASS